VEREVPSLVGEAQAAQAEEAQEAPQVGRELKVIKDKVKVLEIMVWVQECFTTLEEVVAPAGQECNLRAV
tara:strand:- start:186 stop:395 length:210 start_codon:yes stop_codon:yes gene_type:complete